MNAFKISNKIKISVYYHLGPTQIAVTPLFFLRLIKTHRLCIGFDSIETAADYCAKGWKSLSFDLARYRLLKLRLKQSRFTFYMSSLLPRTLNLNQNRTRKTNKKKCTNRALESKSQISVSSWPIVPFNALIVATLNDWIEIREEQYLMTVFCTV